MKKHLLLSTLLGVAALFSTTQSVFATTQVISGVLATTKTITVGAGTTTTTIDSVDGHLGTTLTPSFNVSTNEDTGGITYKARVTTTTGPIDTGLYNSGTPAVDCYIALCNTISSRLPTTAAVTSAFTSGSSPNVIAYRMTLPTHTTTSGTGTLADFTWTGATTGTWNSTGTVGGGVFNVTTNIGVSAQNSSYEPALDLAGEYQATLILTFDS